MSGFAWQRGAEPSRWLAGLHVGGPALRDCSSALVRPRWLRNSACGLKHARHPLAKGKGQTWAGLRACDAHTGAPPATDSALVAPLEACQGPAAVACHQRGAKGWADCRPGALWGLRSTASRWARAARIVDKLAGVV